MVTYAINAVVLQGRQIASQLRQQDDSAACRRVDVSFIHRSLVSTRDEWKSHIKRASQPERENRASQSGPARALLSNMSIHHIYRPATTAAVGLARHNAARFRKSNHFIMWDDGYLFSCLRSPASSSSSSDGGARSATSRSRWGTDRQRASRWDGETLGCVVSCRSASSR